MRIAYLSSSEIPSSKANSIQVMNFCNALAQLGHSVTLFAKSKTQSSKNSSGEPVPKDIQTYYGISNNFSIIHEKDHSLRFFGGLVYGKKVYNRIKDFSNQPDLLYGRNLYALIACLKLNKPLIYESHAAPNPIRKRIEGYLFSKPQFKLLAVINKALYLYYKQEFEIFKKEPEKLILLPDGGSVHSLSAPKENVHKKPILGYSGSFYPGKGVDLILSLAQRLPDLTFAIAGGTETQVARLREKYTAKNIIFKGFLPPGDVPKFLSECDILLAPYSDKVYSSCTEKRDLAPWMSPLKLFEYMAAKKPIIASRLDAIEEILEDSKSALLADCNSIESWELCISKILCKPFLGESLGKNAFEDLKGKYTWEKRGEKVLKALKLDTPDSNLKKTNDEKPVILHIIGDFNLGGAEKTLLKLLSNSKKERYVHHALSLFSYGELFSAFQKAGANPSCVHIPKKSSELCNPIHFLRLIKKIRKIKPILIQSWLYHSNNLINLLSPFFRNTPIINNIRHEDPKAGSLKTKISAQIGALLARLGCNKIIFCSQSSVNKHIAIGYPKNKVKIIPNGFDIRQIDKIKAKNALKKAFKIKDSHKIAIIVGRYCEEKDYPNLLAALEILLKKYDKVEFIFCGKGLTLDNRDFYKLVSSPNLRKHCHFLGSRTDVSELMAGADLLISSSSSEAFPNVIAEAMSLETPCIATDVGESKNIIGDTGIIIPPKNHNKLATALFKFLNFSDRMVRELGKKAKDRIKLNYCLNKTLEQYESLYSYEIDKVFEPKC